MLKSLNYLDQKLIAYLFDGHFSFNPRLRGPMKEILEQYAATKEGNKMIKDFALAGTWDESQEKRLNLILR